MNTFSIGDMGQAQDVNNPLVVSSGLVSQWSFNDGSGSIARDCSGNNNDGKLLGTILPRWIPGLRGSSLWFTGSSIGYVSIPDKASIRPGSGSWTMVCSFNAPNVNQLSSLIYKTDTTTYNQMEIGIGHDNGSGTGIASKHVFLFT